MTKSSSILIDGSNFYFKLKDLKLNRLLTFDFTNFKTYLEDNKYTSKINTFYVGAVKTDGTKEFDKRHADQQKLLLNLKKHKYSYKLGYLLKNDGKISEKGVDVQMATDLLIQSYEKKVQTIFLVSSDTDLIPSVKQAIKLGVEVVYVGFKHLPSKALMRSCSRFILLEKKTVTQFLKTK
jgi:uncharacterized LabA/DUF88 family protein